MKEHIPIRILNPTPQEIKLPAGTHLGKLMEAEMERVEEYPQTDECDGDVPVHLDNLMEKAIKEHSEGEARKTKSLLMDYQDVFCRKFQ
jgi:hypothetical protein